MGFKSQISYFSLPLSTTEVKKYKDSFSTTAINKQGVGNRRNYYKMLIIMEAE